jgi:hypothetical protein
VDAEHDRNKANTKTRVGRLNQDENKANTKTRRGHLNKTKSKLTFSLACSHYIPYTVQQKKGKKENPISTTPSIGTAPPK